MTHRMHLGVFPRYLVAAQTWGGPKDLLRAYRAAVRDMHRQRRRS